MKKSENPVSHFSCSEKARTALFGFLSTRQSTISRTLVGESLPTWEKNRGSKTSRSIFLPPLTSTLSLRGYEHDRFCRRANTIKTALTARPLLTRRHAKVAFAIKDALHMIFYQRRRIPAALHLRKLERITAVPSIPSPPRPAPLTMTATAVINKASTIRGLFSK